MADVVSKIKDFLEDIELVNDVKILLAVESGSRAWGVESKNSDWDVRFIYVHKPEWFFRIGKQRDVIEHVYGDVDLVGWELRKALTLLQAGNVTLNEWINSPIVYHAEDEFVSRIREVEPEFFKTKAAMYHYAHFYKNHDEMYLQKEKCDMKRFLYYLRGVLACKWLEHNKSLPPVPFDELVNATVEDEEMRAKIAELIRLKKSGEEHEIQVVDNSLMEYARQLGDYYNDFATSLKPERVVGIIGELDAILYDMALLYT